MEYKKPLTINEQIEYLKVNKRIVFNEISEEDAKKILLKFGYINIISPFKYMFANKQNGIPSKINGKHVYPREVDFYEYYQKYLQERTPYKNIYKNISRFEVKFNSIVTHNLILYYSIDSNAKFDNFINEIKNNVLVSSYKETVKEHMLSELDQFHNKMNNYDSIYIFMDRLSLGSTITLFRCCDEELKRQIFDLLKSYNATVGYSDFKTFDEDFLFRIVSIRNCISHNNSLTILTRYYDIKNKSLRSDSDKRKFKNIIKRLL